MNIRALFASGGMLLAVGCFFDTERVAGGEDFPNTLEPLGKVASEQVASHNQWDQFQDIPQPASLQNADSLAVDPPLVSVYLTKSVGSSAPDTIWDYRDTALADGGVVRKYVSDNNWNTDRYDTLIFRWDDAFRDGVPGNDLLLEARGYLLTRSPYKLQPYRFLNRDAFGKVDQADFVLIQKGLDSVLRVQHIQVRAGADGDLDLKADNRVVLFETMRFRNGDTLEAAQIVDADGDSALWADGDSGIVELRHKVQAPPFQPKVAVLSGVLKAKIYRKGDSSVPLVYRQRRILKNGGEVVFSAHGKRGDSLLVLGDTALVVYDYTAPVTESLIESKGRFLVLLGGEPWRFKDNVLLGFSIENRWRSGVIRRAMLSFTPDTVLPSGRLDIHGVFNLSLGYDDDGTGEVAAIFRDGKFQIILRELRRGLKKAFRLVFDNRGRLLEHEALAP